jgi:hypothetical protein
LFQLFKDSGVKTNKEMRDENKKYESDEAAEGNPSSLLQDLQACWRGGEGICKESNKGWEDTRIAAQRSTLYKNVEGKYQGK